MNYGYFDDTSREYVITNPKIPVRWINYIGTLAFGGFIDHTGGALICKGDPALNRITKYIPQLPASNFNGETLYVRLLNKHGYKVFSPYFVPTLNPYDLYKCHVGAGYTRLITEFYGIRTEALIFVPMGESLVIRYIKVSNLSDGPQTIDLIPVVEYSHPDALKQFTNADWVPQTMQSEVVEDGPYKILLQYPFMFRDTKVNYFTSNQTASSFDTDRKTFLGDHGYGTWEKPESLKNVELNNSVAQRGDNIAALLHHLGTLNPGESSQITTILGQADSIDTALPSIEKFRLPKAIDNAFEELNHFWEGYLSTFQIKTPDSELDVLLNVYNPRQCYLTKNWSRYLSLYQLGLGARGIGFRDSSQDVLGIMANVPIEGVQLIRTLLQVQKHDGSAMHQFNPITMVANEGDSRENEDAPKYYSDDHLWIIIAICAYLKETGDFDFLQEMIPYYEKDKHDQPLEKGSVLDHMQRAIEFTHNDLGQHGLPLLGFADWNDTVNLPAGSESLFSAFLFGKALLEMIELFEYLGDNRLSAKYETYHGEMKASVNNWAWDGEWYVRYFDQDGKPLGSKDNSQGKIYTNGQSWAVISGYAPENRARMALDSVYKHLNTRNGIKLSAPGYNGYDPTIGGISTYPPGAKENGGIFLHTNPWVIMAEAILGNGERAFEYYSQINPVRKNDSIDEFECEPYVYPQNILGDEHPQFGLARNSWLTGTASWAYQAGTQYILGIRPTYRGLEIDPCIPYKWDEFSITRIFRRARYDLLVQNPEHVNKGVREIKVDDAIISGNILPIFEDDQIHRVNVLMG